MLCSIKYDDFRILREIWKFSRQDRDFHFIILMFRDEIEITYCYSHVSRRERELEIEFLTVEREKSQSILTRSRENENSRYCLLQLCTQNGDAVVIFKSETMNL